MSNNNNDSNGVSSAPSKYIPPALRNASSGNTSSSSSRPKSGKPASNQGFDSYRSGSGFRGRDSFQGERRWSDSPSSSAAPSEGSYGRGSHGYSNRSSHGSSFSRGGFGSRGGYGSRSGYGGDRDSYAGSSYNRYGNQGQLSSTYNVVPRNPNIEEKLFGTEKRNESGGIDFAVYDNIPVEVSGSNPPKPITSFNDVQLDEFMRVNLDLCGYVNPTPIQKYSVPIALEKRDLIACAQTGSGKTAAFLIPIVCTILKSKVPEAYLTNSSRIKAHPQALIVGPTRELVTQIYKEALKFTYCTTVRPAVVYGGVPLQSQLRDLNRVDILVATPGRLVDLCEQRAVSFSKILILVLDEADRMLDMGFQPQIQAIVNDFDMPHDGRQTLMFSATFPKAIQTLAQEFLRDYIFLTVGRVGSSTNLITQRIEFCADRDSDKRDLLKSLLPEFDGLTIVFVETKRGADSLEDWLVSNGIESASIHGDRTQRERELALQYFKDGRCPVLVATGVASRGLSIPDVRFVVNYDMPNTIDEYVHRIGRTGRAGATGTAISFVTEKCRGIARELIDLMHDSNQVIPPELLKLSTSYSNQSRGRGGYGNYGGYRGGNKYKTGFGAQDMRQGSGSRYNNYSNTNNSFNNRQTYNDGWSN